MFLWTVSLGLLIKLRREQITNVPLSIKLNFRFSSGDLASEYEDGEEVRQRQADLVSQPAVPGATPAPAAAAPAQTAASAGGPQQTSQPPSQPLQHQQQQQQQQQQQESSGFSFGTFRPGGRTTSAPSSPSKTRESFLQRVQSLTSGVTRYASTPSGWCTLGQSLS